MHEDQEIVEEEPENKGTVVSESETTLQMLLQKVVGGNTFTPTERQVDEVLSQRRQVIGYIHDDKKTDSYDSKFYLVVVLIFILVFSGLVLWFKSDLFPEVLSFLAGLFGGGIGGYGFGKIRS